MEEYKVKVLMLLAIIILSSCSNRIHKCDVNTPNMGWFSRLEAMQLKMNCEEDKLAIYTQYAGYMFEKHEYKFYDLKEGLGLREFAFRLAITKEDRVAEMEGSKSISFCWQGELYHGREQEATAANHPPACHFYFRIDDNGKIKRDSLNRILCFSQKYMDPDQYAKEVLGVEKLNE